MEIYNTIMEREREFVSRFMPADGLSDKAIDALFDELAAKI